MRDVKVGDTLFFAWINYRGDVEIETATAKSVGPSTIRIGASVAANGYRRLVYRDAACLTRSEALSALCARLEGEAEARRSALAEANKTAAKAREALAAEARHA